MEGRKDGWTDGYLEIPPLCPTGYQPFGAAAQKGGSGKMGIGIGEGNYKGLSVFWSDCIPSVGLSVPESVISSVSPSLHLMCGLVNLNDLSEQCFGT